jgi:integrase/recombinase XerD
VSYTINGDVVLSRPPEGPLARHLAAFAMWASEQGYARYSRYRQVLLASCFSRWLGQHAITARRVSSEQLARYLRSRTRRARHHNGDAAALGQFVDFLRRRAWCPLSGSSRAG